MAVMNMLFISTVMAHEQTTKLSGQFCEVDFRVSWMYDEESWKLANSTTNADSYKRTGLIFATQCNKGDATTTHGWHSLENLVTVCDLNLLKMSPTESEGYPFVVCVYTGKQLARTPLEKKQ